MSVSNTYTKNVKIGTKCTCYCNQCKIITKHSVISDIEDKGYETDDGINWCDDYQIIQCDNCSNVSFRRDGWFSEYQDEENDGSYEELYPDSEENIRQQKKYKLLPFSLSEIYEEVMSAYNKNLFILSAVGIRAILEGICKDKKISSGLVPDKKGVERTRISLEGKIYGLLQNNLINKAQFEALHELRFLGNNAVHQLDEPSKIDIQTALDIIEHMIYDLYEIPLKSTSLRKRREK